ncbi:Stk1 family PASTA domain-containing Ser/Thr kinase [Bacillus sp. 2205SS5-2]|uniref:Stk1 family PASTA domain-containing Ser/Thr kinase n=1 Tax=Bacillus sp. 2205SS5-2 TaxID=3109031 RepID=UPI0030053A72
MKGLLIGKRISGRYKVLETIGGGGMANVYLATDMILDRDVAIKVLRMDFANEDEFIRRFKREAQSATSLAHSNIVNIFDVGEDDGIYYLVMEYIDGLTLKQYIQKYYPVSLDKAIDIMEQLTSAIEHAHQHHIIHRDIKPQNILIDHGGTVKITDFGIAMALTNTSITQTNSVLGSVHYLSPEQARGGMATNKSDIYSLGIVMFELFTGRLPFSGESAVSIALKHLQAETPSLKRWNQEVPQSIENIVLKATAKDPFQRYNNVEEMREDLSSSLDPNRLNEPKFSVPIDEEATRAIPVITDQHVDSHLSDTKIHDTSELTNVQTPQQPIQNPKKRRKWPWILLFLMVVGLGTAAYFVLPQLMGPKDVEVPDISEKGLSEAYSIIVNHELDVGAEKEISDEEIEKGLIIKSEPKAGSFVKEGSKIDLFISSGKKTYSLENYVGKSYEQAKKQLEAAGFTVNQELDYSTEPEGTITKQSLESGELFVPSETEITLDVSQGVEIVTLDDLQNMSFNELNNYEEDKKINITIEDDYEYSGTVSPNRVIRQSPQPGTEIEVGSTVKVVLSKGKEPLPPRQVTKTITIPYEPSEPPEDSSPNEVTVYYQDSTVSNEEVDTFQITADKPYTFNFYIEEGDKATWKVIRDGEVILEDELTFEQAQ